MWPMLTGLVTGGASLLGNIFSSNTSAANTQAQIQGQEAMQAQSEAFNAEQAGINRAWQQQMSSTAYQRSRADMVRAGLNPMAMAGMGGASTPGGATASVGTPTMPTPQRTSPFANLGDAVSKTVNSAIAEKTFEKMTEEIANLVSERGRIEAATRLTGEETRTQEQETVRRGNLASLTGLQLPGARVSAKEAEGVEGLGEKFLKGAGIGKYAGQSVGDIIAPFVSSAGGVSRMLTDKAFRNSVKLRDDINRGNFIGKYGVPLDEYLKD